MWILMNATKLWRKKENNSNIILVEQTFASMGFFLDLSDIIGFFFFWKPKHFRMAPFTLEMLFNVRLLIWFEANLLKWKINLCKWITVTSTWQIGSEHKHWHHDGENSCYEINNCFYRRLGIEINEIENFLNEINVLIVKSDLKLLTIWQNMFKLLFWTQWNENVLCSLRGNTVIEVHLFQTLNPQWNLFSGIELTWNIIFFSQNPFNSHQVRSTREQQFDNLVIERERIKTEIKLYKKKKITSIIQNDEKLNFIHSILLWWHENFCIIYCSGIGMSGQKVSQFNSSTFE